MGDESGWSCGHRVKSVMESHVVVRVRDTGRSVQESDLRHLGWTRVVKERFFTTPLCWDAIETAKRRPDSQQEHPARAPRTGSYDNSNGKGKGKMTKGNGKGKESKSKVVGCAEFNAEGKRICLTYNNPYQKCTMGKNCRFMYAGGVRWRSCQCTSVNAHQLLPRHTEKTQTSAGPPAEVDAVAGCGIEEARKGTSEELEPSSKGSCSESFRVLCLFAWRRSDSGFGSYLHMEFKRVGLGVLVDEIDILRNRRSTTCSRLSEDQFHGAGDETTIGHTD